MTKLTLTDIGSTLTNTAATQINANNAATVAAVENTLSRDGSTPNSMQADIDMDGNDLLNVGVANINSLVLDGQAVTLTDLSALPPDVMLKSAATPDADITRSFGSSALRWLKGWFGNISLFPDSSVTPTINGEVTLQLTSNTSLTFKVRGSDGIVRSGSITLS